MTCYLFGEWGFGLSKVEVINVVGEFCRQNRRQNSFKHNVPGPDLVGRVPTKAYQEETTASTTGES